MQYVGHFGAFLFFNCLLFLHDLPNVWVLHVLKKLKTKTVICWSKFKNGILAFLYLLSDKLSQAYHSNIWKIMKKKQTIKKQKGTKMSESDSKIQLRMFVPE
jgi:hypothetical protein